MPSLKIAAEKEGIEVHHIMFSDFGWQMYHMGIVASDGMIGENPDLIRRFLEATYKGVEYAFEHPEEAAQMTRKYWPELDETDAIESTLIVKEKLVAPALDAGKTGVAIGEMDPEKVQKTYDAMYEFFEPVSTIPVEDIYTNEFVKS
jgi:NitT/TauT family transport system substrate-binding protein